MTRSCGVAEGLFRASTLTIALLALVACGGSSGGGHRRTATPSPAGTPTPTAAPCPLGPPFCGGDFPLNTVMTTQYGPAWADVTLSPNDFVPCFGPYALCYYANCTVGPDNTSVCPCFEWYGTSYVLTNAILNLDSYQATASACATPGACQYPNGAPVCGDINNGSFLESASRVSTFSFYRAQEEMIGFTDCSSQPNRSPYAGCMTGPCFGPPRPGPDPHTVAIDCDCPVYDGPYQIGQFVDPAVCDDTPMAWSASYHPQTPPANPCELVNGCVPDAPTDECGCGLYVPGQTAFPPGSNIDCDTVCQEYDSCDRADIELGYTCDATLCTSKDHDLVFDACLGLEQCSLTEIFKAETAAQCSCCASQLCHCTPNAATNVKIGQLNASQVADGDTPQCNINGTLCGTSP